MEVNTRPERQKKKRKMVKMMTREEESCLENGYKSLFEITVNQFYDVPMLRLRFG